MTFDDFLNILSKIKNLELPAEASHLKMMPPFRQELLELQRDAIKNAKNAGVMALFYPDFENQTRFVLIQRKPHQGVHSSQIAFPGGKYEKQDQTIEYTALRETFEEVGVPINLINVVKKLSQVYIPPSNFYVHPFIGFSSKRPNFIKQENEVDAIVEVALNHFLDDKTVVVKKVKTSYSIAAQVPAFELNNQVVWGATAMILSEIKDLIKPYI